MCAGYSPSVTTCKPATIYTHSFGGQSSSEPSLQVITPLNSSISVIIPSADTQHHTTESHWISESNVFGFPVEQGSKISENETPLKVGQEAGDARPKTRGWRSEHDLQQGCRTGGWKQTAETGQRLCGAGKHGSGKLVWKLCKQLVASTYEC